MKVAICFYGITRSVPWTVASIRENVYEPLKGDAVCRLGHFFEQAGVDNPRSGEQGVYGRDDWRLLDLDVCVNECDSQDAIEAMIARVRLYRDVYDDDYRTLYNCVKQLYSIQQCWDMMVSEEPDVCLFLRPDLRYHEPLGAVVRQAAAVPGVYVPAWQDWGGMNDRFAIGTPAEMRRWAFRFEEIPSFLEAFGYLHPEELVGWVMRDCLVYRIGARASRVRLGGVEVEEDFMLNHPVVSGL